MGQTGRAFIFVAWLSIFWGACTTLFFKGGQSRLWHGEGPVKPGFKDFRVVRALRVLGSVWGVGWGGRGRVAPKLAGFEPRRHAHPA